MRKDFLEKLIKGSGEGSRGGKVVGHTKTGKPIYDKEGHAEGTRKPFPGEKQHEAPDVSMQQAKQTYMPAEGTEHHYADSSNMRAYKNVLRAFKQKGLPFQGHITYDSKTDTIKTLSDAGSKAVKEIVAEYQKRKAT